MLAVDTNVVIRFLTLDDPKQGERAKNLFQREEIWLPKTVLLETDWVLRSLYGFTPAAIAEALEKLVALPNVACEDLGAVSAAIGWLRKGIEFADSLHLASSSRAGRFATFDEKFAKRARSVTGIEILGA
jgi:predicted nucleic acid-binding protein